MYETAQMFLHRTKYVCKPENGATVDVRIPAANFVATVAGGGGINQFSIQG